MSKTKEEQAEIGVGVGAHHTVDGAEFILGGTAEASNQQLLILWPVLGPPPTHDGLLAMRGAPPPKLPLAGGGGYFLIPSCKLNSCMLMAKMGPPTEKLEVSECFLNSRHLKLSQTKLTQREKKPQRFFTPSVTEGLVS